MATKKPTAAQLAARKKFSEAAKNGTLRKKTNSSKKGLKGTCIRNNADGTRTIYTAKNGTTCHYGGKPLVKTVSTLSPAKATYSLGKPATKKRTITAKKLCSKVIRREGLKVDGTLKKGYHYTPGGKVVKAKPAPKKKAVAKKKPTTKKTPKKKFLGIF